MYFFRRLAVLLFQPAPMTTSSPGGINPGYSQSSSFDAVAQVQGYQESGELLDDSRVFHRACVQRSCSGYSSCQLHHDLLRVLIRTAYEYVTLYLSVDVAK